MQNIFNLPLECGDAVKNGLIN